MSFAQPIYLWALTGIIIPVAIHLLSRKEGKVIKVGSLRHMEETNTSRFKSLRLNEIWLMLARCLMISWLALFLSGASCTSSPTSGTTRWMVIEKGIEKEATIKSFMDSLSSNGFELRYLTEGFPSSPPSDSLHGPDYWTLAAELGKKTSHDVVVISYNKVKGFRLTRPTLPSNLRWIPVNPPAKDFLVQATRMKNQLVAVRTGHSDPGGTSLATSNVTTTGKEWITMEGYTDSVTIESRDTVGIAIESDEAHENDARVLRASMRALESIPQIQVVETEASKADWVFWLRDETPKERFSASTVLLRPQEQQEWFVQQGPSEWHLTRRLTSNDALEEHFTIEYARLLTGRLGPKHLSSKDVRTLPEPMTWSSMPGLVTAGDGNAVRDLSVFIIVLFMLTWIAERVLAIRRNL
jgi:hypothetical protein